MSLPDQFFYHFFPVGQGLFAAGLMHRTGEERPRFLWVYDCGTSSGKHLIERSISNLGECIKNRKRIDLLVLSHFDHDHISGVCSLLQEFKVGTLMLPYMSLAQRLIVAFEEDSGEPDDQLTEFYLNPVAYLLSNKNEGIERILFVSPSDNDGPDDNDGPRHRNDPQESRSDNGAEIDFESDRPNDEDKIGLMSQLSSPENKTSVEFLKQGSSIIVRSHSWEFIPYNDDPKKLIPDDFEHKVNVERANLLSANDRGARKEALKNLKQAYDQHFGSGSEERNLISLFLYSGPIYSSWKDYSLVCDCSGTLRSPLWWSYVRSVKWLYCNFIAPRDDKMRSRCSILYSGDGYLDSKDRLQKLFQYMGGRRMQKTGVFQVMHHGAETNWHKGVAAAIAPLFSVFSSDPFRRNLKHPHAAVLQDFWPYGAVRVDKEVGFSVHGFLYSRY